VPEREHTPVTPLPSILDGHNDTLQRLWRSGESFADDAPFGHLDLARARAGGFAAGFFAIFVQDGAEFDRERLVELEGGYRYPLAPPVDREVAAPAASEMAEVLAAQESLRLVRRVGELEACLAGDSVGAILHLEGAEPLDPGLSDLEAWYERGLRSLGLVWSRPNAFGHGVPFEFPGSPDTGPGLTPAGRELVRACNRLGIVVDLAHANERTFRDAAAVSEAPLVVTHAAAHALCPATRNVTDEQLRAIAASGGVLGVAFDVAMLRPDGALDTDLPLDVLVRHLEHVAEVAGLDHVTLGSDFDGCAVPDAIGDAAGLPRVLEAVRAAGWSDDELGRLAHGSWLRVLRATWQG
jgi:membrane dipeptidase